MKQCTKCQQVKPLDMYHKAAYCKDGLSYTCKDCVKERSRNSNEKHRAKRRQSYYERKGIPCPEKRVYAPQQNRMDYTPFQCLLLQLYSEGKTPGQISKEIRKPYYTVYESLHRAKEKLFAV